MNNFNYFFTSVGPEYKKTFARNVGIAVLILFAFYGTWSMISDTQPATTQIEELIDTFKEKYSDYEIMEFPDSKGVPYKYSVKTNYGEVELILEKDRVVLKAWSNDEPVCIVSNPIPRDILNNCPSKW